MWGISFKKIMSDGLPSDRGYIDDPENEDGDTEHEVHDSHW